MCVSCGFVYAHKPIEYASIREGVLICMLIKTLFVLLFGS